MQHRDGDSAFPTPKLVCHDIFWFDVFGRRAATLGGIRCRKRGESRGFDNLPVLAPGKSLKEGQEARKFDNLIVLAPGRSPLKLEEESQLSAN